VLEFWEENKVKRMVKFSKVMKQIGFRGLRVKDRLTEHLCVFHKLILVGLHPPFNSSIPYKALSLSISLL
jgi:hypothetical protein